MAKSLRHMRVQPAAVFGGDAGIDVEVHLVDHLAHIATRPIAIEARMAKLSNTT